jgi:hypothetical protein
VDDIDTLAVMEEREAARFAAALKAQRERPLPTSNFCQDCGEILELHRRQLALCFYCASKREARMNWR